MRQRREEDSAREERCVPEVKARKASEIESETQMMASVTKMEGGAIRAPIDITDLYTLYTGFPK